MEDVAFEACPMSARVLHQHAIPVFASSQGPAKDLLAVIIQR